MLRRDFLRSMCALAAMAAASDALPSQQQSLSYYLTAPSSDVPTVLWLRRGADSYRIDYSTPEGYRMAQYLLRDVRANVMGHPSQGLLRILSWQQAWLAAYQVHQPHDILSGLRTRATNSMTEGAAYGSLHLPDRAGVFRAVDSRMPSISSEYLGRLAALARAGGVGFYRAKDFTHIDDGRQRIWRK